MNLPNKISVFRMCLIPVFVVFYYLTFPFAPYVATAVFILAALTDFLDGYIARKYNMVTDLGKLLDPMADKVLVCTALFAVVSTNTLGTDWSLILLAAGSSLILARELLISAVRQIAAAKNVVIQANGLGKLKTITQDVALPFLILLKADDGGIFFDIVWWCALVLFGLAIAFTVLSGVVYMVQNRGVFTADK
jgi:CDP-diacylglycerol--glycerol-3-phosphate 3-phosphatidyltransferase